MLGFLPLSSGPISSNIRVDYRAELESAVFSITANSAALDFGIDFNAQPSLLTVNGINVKTDYTSVLPVIPFTVNTTNSFLNLAIGLTPYNIQTSGVNISSRVEFKANGVPLQFNVAYVDSILSKATLHKQDPATFSTTFYNTGAFKGYDCVADSSTLVLNFSQTTKISHLLSKPDQSNYYLSGYDIKTLYDRNVISSHGNISINGQNTQLNVLSNLTNFNADILYYDANIIYNRILNGTVGSTQTQFNNIFCYKDVYLTPTNSSYSLSGNDLFTLYNKAILANSNTLLINGTDTLLAAGKFLNLENGNIVFNLNNTKVIRDLVSNNNTLEYQLNHIDAALAKESIFKCDTYTISLSGNQFTGYTDRYINSLPTEISSNGNSISAKHNRIHKVEPAVYNLSGKYTTKDLISNLNTYVINSDVKESKLIFSRNFAIDKFNIDLSLLEVYSNHDRVLSSMPYIISLNYNDIILAKSSLFYPNSTAFDINGNNSDLNKHYYTNSESGEFTTEFKNKNLILDRIFKSKSGTFYINGNIVFLEKDYTRPGHYNLSGFDADLVSDLQIYEVNPDYIVFCHKRSKEVTYKFSLNNI